VFTRIGERLSNLTPNRFVFRLLAISLLLAILISRSSWVGRLASKLLNFPELRHRVSVDMPSNEEMASASLTVSNLGFGAATNVLIHVKTEQCHLAHYEIDSQELYQERTADIEGGEFNVWLDRVASGARVEIELIGTGLVTDAISLSAVSDQGASNTIDSPTFSGQAEAYRQRLSGVFGEAAIIIKDSPPVHEVGDWVSARPVLAKTIETIASHEFKTVGLAALIVIFLMAIFLRDTYFLWLTSLIIGFVAWLFFDFHVPSYWLVLLLGGLAIVVIFLSERNSAFKILTAIAILGVVLLAVSRYWNGTVSGRWIAGIVASLVTLVMITTSGSSR